MLTRRRFLGVAGAGAAGLAAGAGSATFFERTEGAGGDDATVPFYGPHQAGIATAAQEKLVFASFDLTLSTAGSSATCCGNGPPPRRP